MIITWIWLINFSQYIKMNWWPSEAKSGIRVLKLTIWMDSTSNPISNASFLLHPTKDGNQDQEHHSPSSIAECLNELENELGKVVPWTCPMRLKVLLGRIAMKVQKDKPTMGKMKIGFHQWLEKIDLLHVWPDGNH